MLTTVEDNAYREALRFLDESRPQKLRTMGQFAEQEIYLPNGPFTGRRYNLDRQPYARLWFEAVDSRRWKRHNALGPTQTGKTLTCLVIPICYHVFELRESFVCGIPDINMVTDKWSEDIRPVIEASRYRAMLPRGDKGLIRNAVRFGNGATLRFMTGGGGDKARAGYTTRVLGITETDGMDCSAGTSAEADKVTQLEGRLRAYRNYVEYLECTVTTEDGRTWREHIGGTESRIVQHCPYCEAYVTLLREHLQGWQSAGSKIEAMERGYYVCPACSHAWSESDRTTAARDSRLVHRGQSILPDGTIIGEPPKTDTLGFRWTAPDNLFLTAGDVAGDEWTAQREQDAENADRKLCQFVWAIPCAVKQMAYMAMEPIAICERQNSLGRGSLPTDTAGVTAGLDVGLHTCHYAVLAWTGTGNLCVVDYGTIEVPEIDVGYEKGLKVAFRQYRDLVTKGYTWAANVRDVDAAWVDSGGKWTGLIYDLCKEAGEPFMPSKGYGASQDREREYRAPKSKTNTIRKIGDGYHIVKLRAKKCQLAECNADHWKTFISARLKMPKEQPGAMTLFHREPSTEHFGFAKHLTAETEVEEFVPDKGVITRWKKRSVHNHWLDALWIACAAAAYAGAPFDAPAADDDADGKPEQKPKQKARKGWYKKG